MKIILLSLLLSSFAQASVDTIADKAWVLDTEIAGCPSALVVETGSLQFDPDSGKRESMHYFIRSFYKNRADQLLQETWSNFQVALDGQKSIKQCFYDSDHPKTCVKMRSEESEGQLMLQTESKSKLYENGKKVKIQSERSYQFDLQNNQLKLSIATKAGEAKDFVSCDYRIQQQSTPETEVVDTDRSLTKESTEALEVFSATSGSAISR